MLVDGPVQILGFAANAVGLRLLRATGDGVAAPVVFRVQLTGLALATLWAALYAVVPGASTPRSCASPTPRGP